MPNSAIFLQMSYQMSTILIHRPYLREPTNSTSFRLAVRAMTISASIIARLLFIFRKVSGFDTAPPFIIHHILTAAIMHLLRATDSRSELATQAINKLRICLEALEAMQTRWPRVAKAILLLQELGNRWKIVAALPMRFSNYMGNMSADTSDKEGVYLADDAQWNDEVVYSLWNNDNDQSISDDGNPVLDANTVFSIAPGILADMDFSTGFSTFPAFE
ncbi:hypothetical protein BP5796_11950 [Coleophoma crateriformis]|uniref:Transcription factor domain-containing protein n=1 Tax=Coleophoma crateriformis TaxID=565419 RepID=A0A3D8QB15_9HELO|nr:hypothetical protein BP5796_11950 [Coleophoma crateriformis]